MSLCGACKFGDCVWIKESQRINNANKKKILAAKKKKNEAKKAKK